MLKSKIRFAVSHPALIIEYLKRRSDPDPIRRFFALALIRQDRLLQEGWSPAGNYYEFGVGERTLIPYIKALKYFCRRFNKDIYNYHLFGFDTFEGLPPKESQKDDHLTWGPRGYWTELPKIKEKVTKQGIDLQRGSVRFVKGLYKDTLTDYLRNELAEWPPSIVTIDVDYYSSSKEVLEWLRPILKSGTLFYFDDIWSFHGNPDYGELAAIREFNDADQGYLVSFPVLGLQSHVYIYSKKDFEFKGKTRDLPG